MADDKHTYAHDSSDKKLDRAATEVEAAREKAAAKPNAGHDEEKVRKHDDTGKDRLFEGRIQHDDADKQSDRNRLEKDAARHHHTDDEIGTISDTDTHAKK